MMMMTAFILFVTQILIVLGFTISVLFGNDITNNELGLMVCCAMNTGILARIME